NAMLAMAYLLAFECTGEPLYKQVCQRIFSYLQQEMQDESGLFFSAQDADTEGEEGKYYLFTQEEILQLLGEEEGQRFCEIYDIRAQGNFAGANIPNLLRNKGTE